MYVHGCYKARPKSHRSAAELAMRSQQQMCLCNAHMNVAMHVAHAGRLFAEWAWQCRD